MKIIVPRGSGIIPRTNYLCPKLDPFEATKDHVKLILSAGMSVQMVSPIDGHKVEVNSRNLEKMWKLYDHSIGEVKRREQEQAKESARSSEEQQKMIQEAVQSAFDELDKGSLPGAVPSPVQKIDVKTPTPSAPVTNSTTTEKKNDGKKQPEEKKEEKKPADAAKTTPAKTVTLSSTT